MQHGGAAVPPPPMSPALKAPPVKKQRAGNTPEVDALTALAGDAVSRRRAELLKLQHEATNNPVIDRARNQLSGMHHHHHVPGVVAGGPPTMRGSGGHHQYRPLPPAVVRSRYNIPYSGSFIIMNTSFDDDDDEHDDYNLDNSPPVSPSSTLTPQEHYQPSTAEQQQQPPLQQSQPPPPAKPGMAKMQPRRSDLFPTVTKSPVSSKPTMSTPALPMMSMAAPKSPGGSSIRSVSSSSSSAAVTASVLKSPKSNNSKQQQQQDSNSIDAQIARRLDFAKQQQQQQQDSAQKSRSKSAPPARPPPPPGPPPLSQEEPAAAASATKKQPPPPPKPTMGGGTVSFSSPTPAGPPRRNKPPIVKTPHPSKIQQQKPTPPTPQADGQGGEHSNTTNQTPPTTAAAGLPPEEETPVATAPTPATKKYAGMTPYHNVTAAAAAPESTSSHSATAAEGSTPPTSAPTISPEQHQQKQPTPPPAAARRDLLRNMRAFADTPPNLKNKSEEAGDLVPHKDEPQQKQHPKSVGFLSPLMMNNSNAASSAAKKPRRMCTPYPKRNVPKPSTPQEVELEKELLQQATSCSSWEYESSEYGDFVIRRPHGLATERDLWYKAGQLNHKTYNKTADVDVPSTLEVVCRVPADDSLICLHGTSHVRHIQKDGNAREYTPDDRLPTISYVANDGSDQQYDLSELLDAALSVRDHYCSTLRSTASGLHKMTMQQQQQRSQQDAMLQAGTKTQRQKKVVETVDKGVETEKMKEEKPKKAQPPPPPVEDDETAADVLGTAIHLFFSVIFGTIWFVCVTIPFRIMTTMFVLFASMAVLTILWLYLADDNGATTMGAAMTMYSNHYTIV